MKRVALVGNMNNNFFALTRYLRDAGHDAHLYYRVGMEHFQPIADSYSDNECHLYCHRVDWLENGFHNVNKDQVNKELAGYDFYIGQGEEAAVAFYAGYTMDIYYPYGSDVYKYAHLPQEYKLKSKIASAFSRNTSRPTLLQMKRGTIAKYLKGAIVNAKYIFADATNEEYKQQIEKLNYLGEFRNVGLPFLYVNEYEQLLHGYKPESAYSEEIDKIRRENEFIMLYHGRQEWKTYHNKFTGKNTDHVIRAFAKYILANQDTSACLVMVEYGSDVEASKALIAELNIEQYVKWFPKMYRKELMYIVKNADLCCGEFAHSFLIYGTVAEAMLMKKPIVTYRDDSYYSDIYSELYPCYNARESDQIAEAIASAAESKNQRTDIGESANTWLKKYFIEYPLQQLFSVIQ
jgi:hypothetical protein